MQLLTFFYKLPLTTTAETDQLPGYFLHFNPKEKSTANANLSVARFVRADSASKEGVEGENQGWRAIPSAGGFPFGVQHFSSTVLLDVYEEMVCCYTI